MTDVFSEVKTWKKPFHKTKARLARVYLKLLKNTKIIAITGSVGKTSTQEAIACVLRQKYQISSGDQNLDPTFRIPQTILKTKPWHKYMVLEYGVEHPGEMDYYLSIARPNIAVYTIIAPTHLKYFKDEEGVFLEKSKMAKSLTPMDYLLLNNKDTYSDKIKNLSKGQVIMYGSGEKSGVKISRFHQNLSGSLYRLHYKGQSETVRSKLIGEHQLQVAYIASTVGIICGLTLKQIAAGLSQIKPPVHRLNLINKKNFSIIDDTYNSSPKASEEAIKTLIELGKGTKKIAILGEMRDLGTKSKELHKQIGVFATKAKIDAVISVGPGAKPITDSAKAANFKGIAINVKNYLNAVVEVKKINSGKPVILVKGSRHEHLERAVFALLGENTEITCYHCGRLK